MLLGLLMMVFGASCMVSEILGTIECIKEYFDEFLFAVIIDKIERKRAAKKKENIKKTENRISRKILMMLVLTAFLPFWLTALILYGPIWLYKLIKRRRAK